MIIKKTKLITFLVYFFLIDLLVLPGVFSVLPMTPGYRLGQLIVTFVSPVLCLFLISRIPKFVWVRFLYVAYVLVVLILRYSMGAVEEEYLLKALAMPYAYLRVGLYFIMGAYLSHSLDPLQSRSLNNKIISTVFILGFVNIIIAILQAQNIFDINEIIQRLYSKGQLSEDMYLFENRPPAFFDGKVNGFSQFLVFLFFLSVGVVYGYRYLIKIGYQILIILGLFLAQTRAMLAPFFLAFVSLIFVKRARILVILAIALISIYILNFEIPENRFGRLIYLLKDWDIIGNISKDTSFYIRLNYTWQTNIDMFEEHPLIGHGLTISGSDDQYLMTLARSGVIGLFIMILEQVYIIIYSLHCRIAHISPFKSFYKAILYSWFVFSVAGIFQPVFDGGRVMELIFFMFGFFHMSNIYADNKS